MARITMGQALEAYNLIRDYCWSYYRSHDGCQGCFFVEEHGGFCGFDTGGFNDCLPARWDDLGLD